METLKSLLTNLYPFIARYLPQLSRVDQEIADLYYIHGLSQNQICSLLEITQAAVSRRLKIILNRIKFLIKMPSLNPVRVRNELLMILPPHLIEYAVIFYWIQAQNRAKYLIETTQSGAANKLHQILRYLEAKAAEVQDPDAEPDKQTYLTLIYLDYFRYILRNSNALICIYKKNDKFRARSIVHGPSVLADDLTQ